MLIPVVDHPQPTVLLTQRAAHLNDHAGQISFPGGKIDATDASPLDTALREAEEEIGLDREFVDPIGYLDLYATGFGFRILPTVARVRPGFKLRVNKAEVDDAFEVPLAFLMDPANHQRAQQGISRHGALLLRHAVRGSLYLGRDRGNPARALRADLSAMIRPAFTEVGIFLIPFAVYALFLLATRSGLLLQIVVAAACHRQAGARLAAAGDRQFRPAGAFFRRAAEFDLHSRAYRERQIRSRS